MSTAITEAIATLADAETRLNLSRTEDEAFFPEWRESLPALSATEREAIETLRRRYLYQRSHGQLLEGTVTLLLASPLLCAAGFYDPPFTVRSEASIQLNLDDADEILQGRLDILVLLDSLWVTIVESKKTALSVWTALPQTLAYLAANPSGDRPSFGVMTNGDELLFLKAVRSPTVPPRSGTAPQSEDSPPPTDRYALSRVFAPFVSASELAIALQILKRLGAIAGEPSR